MMVAILLIAIANLAAIGMFAYFGWVKVRNLEGKVSGMEDKVSSAFVDLANVVEGTKESLDEQVTEVRNQAAAVQLATVGAKGAFMLAASRIAAIADMTCGKLPDWIKEKTSLGKMVEVENAASNELIQFEYLENGDVKSSTYRAGVLVCEILHDANGGVKEGTAYTSAGKPLKRFVYDAMGQVVEQKNLEA